MPLSKETADTTRASVSGKSHPDRQIYPSFVRGSSRARPLTRADNAAAHAALAAAVPSIAVDLPFKVLVSRDEDGVTWLWYNDLRWLARRHGHWRDIECLVRDLAVSLDTVARKAGSPP
jgi:hypothetical protein